MARDTRGQPPRGTPDLQHGTPDLQKVNLDPRHWRQARWALAAEAAVLAVIGVVALGGVIFVAPRGTGIFLGSMPLTEALSWTLIGTALAAGVAALRRRLALWFTAVASIAALVLMFVGAVAGVHHDSGPLGYAAASPLIFAPIFCFNFAVGIWLVPNHIEGPAWLPRRRARHRDGPTASADAKT